MASVQKVACGGVLLPVLLSLVLSAAAATPTFSNDDSHFEFQPQATDPADRTREKRDARYTACLVSGYRIPHGQVFSVPGDSPCSEYYCNNGAWNIYREACEVNGQCHGVGSIFESTCVTYRCDRVPHGQGFLYRPIELKSRCPDFGGVFEVKKVLYMRNRY